MWRIVIAGHVTKHLFYHITCRCHLQKSKKKYCLRIQYSHNMHNLSGVHHSVCYYIIWKTETIWKLKDQHTVQENDAFQDNIARLDAVDSVRNTIISSCNMKRHLLTLLKITKKLNGCLLITNAYEHMISQINNSFPQSFSNIAKYLNNALRKSISLYNEQKQDWTLISQ